MTVNRQAGLTLAALLLILAVVALVSMAVFPSYVGSGHDDVIVSR